MGIVIKKKVSLAFLGDAYKEASLTFSSIPMREYEELTKKLGQMEEDQSQSMPLLRELVVNRFIEGEFPNEEGKLENVTKQDLLEFPVEVFIEVMSQLSGKVSPN